MKVIKYQQLPQNGEWSKATGNNPDGTLILEPAKEAEVHLMKEKEKWAAWNRNINEFKVGDIVWDGDRIVQITNPPLDEFISRCKMICPVERKVDELKEATHG